MKVKMIFMNFELITIYFIIISVKFRTTGMKIANWMYADYFFNLVFNLIS